jgi:hypothetical protein
MIFEKSLVCICWRWFINTKKWYLFFCIELTLQHFSFLATFEKCYQNREKRPLKGVFYASVAYKKCIYFTL